MSYSIDFQIYIAVLPRLLSAIMNSRFLCPPVESSWWWILSIPLTSAAFIQHVEPKTNKPHYGLVGCMIMYSDNPSVIVNRLKSHTICFFLLYHFSVIKFCKLHLVFTRPHLSPSCSSFLVNGHKLGRLDCNNPVDHEGAAKG